MITKQLASTDFHFYGHKTISPNIKNSHKQVLEQHDGNLMTNKMFSFLITTNTRPPTYIWTTWAAHTIMFLLKRDWAKVRSHISWWNFGEQPVENPPLCLIRAQTEHWPIRRSLAPVSRHHNDAKHHLDWRGPEGECQVCLFWVCERTF